jgi:hypothetical protein
LALPVTVAIAVDVTAAMVAVKVALDAFLATVTDEGTDTDELLLASDTAKFAGAMPLSVITQLS